jgi:8-oxo-dGTP pyrophosphatase MutT (NUDIX family)
VADPQTPPITLTRAAAAVLYFDEQGRVMLVHPATRSDYLGIPGGYVEPGETPYETAVRKVKEELGIEPSVGRLLVVDWAPASDGEKVVFVFDGGVIDDETRKRISLNPAALTALSFHEVRELPDLLMLRLVKRINEAVPARAASQTVYLEHGLRRS